MSNLKPIIEESFIGYAGAVIQSRALVDVRDCIKPSARQIFYCMTIDKDSSGYASSKPHLATTGPVGDALKKGFYLHGDTSCLGIIMRAGQPFSMRYPLIEVRGNGGNQMDSGNWAAMRYTKVRFSPLGESLFKDVKKDTITEWRDNVDGTNQYPAVLPSKGFYNVCNGTSGIAVGMASSIPQYNLREMNKALEHLLLNPDCDFEEIYCAPDFATGGILYNEAEVKESMKIGTGAACKLRSKVEYDAKERALIITEIPYSVYTNTICEQLLDIINENEKKKLTNPGIERFNDLTKTFALIKVYLSKGANPDKVLKYLYKNTSLQSYYGINFTMLDKGRFPKVFTWKEMLQAHIDHEKEVYRRGFEFDLVKIKERLHIVEALVKAYSMIEEVIQTIRSAADTQSANIALQKLLGIDDIQAKAILELKLSKLSKLDVNKLNAENEELTKEKDRIENILSNVDLFNKELINGWREVAEKFGDARRTQILNIGKDEEVVEKKQLQISLTNKENLFAIESSTLYTQRRGGVGNKFKLDKDEYVVTTLIVDNIDELLFFTKAGNVYHCKASSIELNQKSYIQSYVTFGTNEKLCAISSSNKSKEYIVFVTKNGYLKKSKLFEYNTNRQGSLKAIALNSGDEIVSVLFTDDEKVGMLTHSGNFLIVESTDARPVGRIAQGIHGIKLNDGDYVVAANLIPSETKELISISEKGYFKRTAYSEFSTQGTNTKGSKIQKLATDDYMADFIPAVQESDLIIGSSLSTIKLKSTDAPLLSKSALGSKSMKLENAGKILKISIL